MTNKNSQEAPSDRGEGKVAPRTPGKAEGERRDGVQPATKDNELANAADEAGSAFLPHDKVLTDPKSS